MHLMYTIDEKGNRLYTLKEAQAKPPGDTYRKKGKKADAIKQKVTVAGKVAKSAHPARFSPDDKFSRHRVAIKKRFGILPTQLPSKPL